MKSSTSKSDNLFRIILIVAGIAMVAFYWLHDPEGRDALWQRILIAGYCFIVSIGSLFIPFIKNRFQLFVHLAFFFAMAWIIEMVWMNQMSMQYVISLFGLFCASMISFQYYKLLIPFILLNVAGAVFLVLTIQSPLINEYYFFAFYLILIFLGYVVVHSRVNTQIKLNRNRTLLTSIFNHAPDAMFLSDGLEGSFSTYNYRAADLFGHERLEKLKSSNKCIFCTSNIDDEQKQAILKTLESKGDYKSEAVFLPNSKDSFDGDIAITRIELEKKWVFLTRISDISIRKRHERIREVIYKITEASGQQVNLDDLFEIIHKEIFSITETTNFYIALYHRESNSIEFSYYHDQFYPNGITDSQRVREFGNGLTEYIIRHRKPLLLLSRGISQLSDEGEIERIGTLPEVFLGVPLVNEGEVIGVMAVQDYETKDRLDSDDLNFMKVVSVQVAAAIVRRQAAEALRESEERFRKIIESTYEGFVIHDGLEILEANEAFAEMFGYTHEEILNKTLFELVPENYREEARNVVSQLYEHPMEIIGKRKNGDIFHMEAVGRNHNYKGKSVRIVAVRDVTEQKKIAEAKEIARREAQFRALVRNSSDIIHILNTSGQILFVSPSFEKVLGYSEDTAAGINFLDLVHGEDKSAIVSLLEQCEQNPGREYQLTYRFTEAEGSHVYLQSIFNNLTADEFVQGILVNSRDITEQFKAEKALIEAEKRLRKQNKALLSLAGANLLSTGDIIDAYKEIIRTAANTLDVERVGIWQFNENQTELINSISYLKSSGEFTEEGTISAQDFPEYFEGIEESRTLVVRDLSTDKRTENLYHAYLKAEGMRSLVDAPIRSEGRILGIVCHEHKDTPREWTIEEQGFAASVADIVSLTIEAAEKLEVQKVLSQSLSILSATLETTADALLVTNRSGNAIAYNRKFLEMWNLGEGNIEHKDTQRVFEDISGQLADPEVLIHMNYQFIQNNRISGFDILELKDGRYIEVYSQPQLQMKSEVERVWSFRDVTQRKLTEEALAENELKYRMLFSQANDAIFLMKKEIFIDCNDKTLEMFRCKRTDIIGKPPYLYSPEKQPDGQDSKTKALKKLNAVLEGQPQFFYWKHKRHDGTLFDAEVSLNRLSYGGDIFVQAMVRDISERLQTEKALRASESRNKAILNAIPDLMLVLSEEGTIIDYKASSHDSVARPRNHAIGMNIRDVMNEDFVKRTAKAISDLFDGSEIVNFEFQIKEKNQVHDFESRLVLSGDDQVLAIVRDVTERKKAENELIQRNFELDSFVYRASHDLKAPLNSIMGLISLAKQEKQLNQLYEYLNMMTKSIVKLDTFIRDLTDFSRNARLESKAAEIDFNVMVNEILDDLKYMSEAKNVQPHICTEGEGPFYSDPVRVRIILNNLISNAIKYQSPDKEHQYIRINIRHDAKAAVISVADNGIGIAEEHLPRLFEMFYRATIRGYGSGLGLYIVKNTVEKLGGNVIVESKINEGSEFIVNLPNRLPH